VHADVEEGVTYTDNAILPDTNPAQNSLKCRTGRSSDNNRDVDNIERPDHVVDADKTVV
jgi:hypothetical protein